MPRACARLIWTGVGGLLAEANTIQGEDLAARGKPRATRVVGRKRSTRPATWKPPSASALPTRGMGDFAAHLCLDRVSVCGQVGRRVCHRPDLACGLLGREALRDGPSSTERSCRT